MAGDEGSLTLAFELSALERMADPETVILDARQWSTYVGIISDKPTFAVTKFAREHRIRQDFFSGPRGREESLEQIKTQFDTDRHVFVGTESADAELADRVEWEYLSVEEAAAAAEWGLAGE